MKKEKGIDDIFKHGLQNPVNEPEFTEHDWDAFENMLDKKGNGGKIIWLPYLSAAAAVLLIAFCWWMFKPAGSTVQNAQQVVKNQPKTQTPLVDTAQVAVKAPATGNEDVISNPEKINSEKDHKETIQQNAAQPVYAAGSANKVKRNVVKDITLPVNSNQNNNDLVAIRNNDIASASNIIASAQPSVNIKPIALQGTPVLASADNLPASAFRPLTATAAVSVKKPTSSAFRPQFALSVLAAPELNGIGSLSSAGKGTNVGMMFTVGVKKFSLSTGVNYTVKPYSLPYSQYPSSYSYKTTPETVTADCRMLDIPINLGYQLYNKSGNKLTFGTGVSSYIMTHETYTYDYGNVAKVYGPSYYAVKDRGKYPFNIMNIQATYERQINSKFGLSLQPYYKIPLSDIGYSQVRIQTFGVALGINWNINQLTKPK